MPIEKNNFLFSNQINVRIDDINYGNHLCHAKLVHLIHNTRALFLKKNNLSEISCFGAGLIMLNLNINYRSECFFDDTLEIKMFLQKIEKVTLEFTYSVMNLTTNKTAAEATTLMGFFDKEKAKLKRIPEEFKGFIKSVIY